MTKYVLLSPVLYPVYQNAALGALKIARQPIDSLLPEATVFGDFAHKNTGKSTANVPKISKSA
ncbi:MAG: hypothetical protein MUE44_30605 [Oscillatoriaceae cyanobacterium Prado104]|jgi:hypothetical protein|nr:hypothetical protein [Oscillatoriaceae cyanobacterium Prado104]